MASRETSRRVARLDQPLEPRRGVPRPHYDPEAFGAFSEAIARFIGTARFLVIQTGVIIVWVVWNLAVPPEFRFDGYPFQFLTLVLSLQAAYAAPLILLAQNRQADRDRITSDEDRTQNLRAKADTEYLAREVADVRIALGEVATRDFLRSQLEELLPEIEHAARRGVGDVESRAAREAAKAADKAARRRERRRDRLDRPQDIHPDGPPADGRA